MTISPARTEIAERDDEPSLGQLFAGLAAETGTLVRKEAELARLEMTQKGRVAARDVAIIAAGGAIAGLGAMALMATLILLLGMVVPLWASSLLVGAGVAIVGVAVTLGGIRAFKGIEAKPRNLIGTLEEDKRWLREQVTTR